MENSRRDMGDSQGRSSAGGGGNAVGDDLYREKAGNRGTVGGITTNIRIVCRGEGLLRGWAQEEGLLAPSAVVIYNIIELHLEFYPVLLGQVHVPNWRKGID